MTKNKFLNKYGLLIFAIFTSFVFIGICSKSSPLYPMNDWVDVQCFFTVGKSMLNGRVLYADIYEQKGPVLYFVFALISLISDTSFIGVYILESVTFGLFLYFSAKIFELYIGKSPVSYIAVLILGAAIPVSIAFTHGGSVEEICLFMMSYGLYTVLKGVRENKPLSFKEGLINGIFAGLMLWMKFSLLGFYVGLCLFVVLWYLVWLRNFKKLLSLIGQFLLGVAAVSTVVMIYFIVTDSVSDMFTAYFYNNIFLYSGDSSVPKVKQILRCVRYALENNLTFSSLIGAGAVFFLVGSFRRLKESLCLLMTGVFLVLLTYWGGKGIMQGYVYYDLVLSVYSVFGLIAVAWLVKKIPIFNKISCKGKKWLVAFVCSVVLIGCALTGFAFVKGRNVYLMSYDKEDMPQYKFAEIINQSENPTLLNYRFLDGGFYYAADVVPNCKYFCRLNIPLEEMWYAQKEYIEEGQIEYIVSREKPITEFKINSDKYELVDTADMVFEGVDFKYYLYRLKEMHRG